MGECERAVEEFLRSADDCLGEYREGYLDADATVRRLERHVDELRDAVE